MRRIFHSPTFFLRVLFTKYTRISLCREYELCIFYYFALLYSFFLFFFLLEI